MEKITLYLVETPFSVIFHLQLMKNSNTKVSEESDQYESLRNMSAVD